MDKVYIAKITTLCPCSCSFCANRKEQWKSRCESLVMPLELFSDFCRAIVETEGKYICLSGGEPTMLKNLAVYVKEAKKHNLVVRINTNGYFLNEKLMMELIDAGLDQIVVSLYSLDKEKLNVLRHNENIFDRTMQAIEVISKYKEAHDFLFVLQTIIMKSNYYEMANLLHFAIKNKADMFWPSYLEDAHYNPMQNLSDFELKEFKELIVPQMKEVLLHSGLDHLVINQALRQCDLFFESEKGFFETDYLNGIYHTREYQCPILGNFACLYNTGYITPCPGHEYFTSKTDGALNSIKNLRNWMLSYENSKGFDYCLYCPQGRHVGINLSNLNIDEHKKL